MQDKENNPKLDEVLEFALLNLILPLLRTDNKAISEKQKLELFDSARYLATELQKHNFSEYDKRRINIIAKNIETKTPAQYRPNEETVSQRSIKLINNIIEIQGPNHSDEFKKAINKSPISKIGGIIKNVTKHRNRTLELETQIDARKQYLKTCINHHQRINNNTAKRFFKPKKHKQALLDSKEEIKGALKFLLEDYKTLDELLQDNTPDSTNENHTSLSYELENESTLSQQIEDELKNLDFDDDYFYDLITDQPQEKQQEQQDELTKNISDIIKKYQIDKILDTQEISAIIQEATTEHDDAAYSKPTRESATPYDNDAHSNPTRESGKGMGM